MEGVKWKMSVDIGEALSWRYCPKCGSELLEVYPGDFTGHSSCMNEHDEDCCFYFDVIRLENGDAWIGGREYGAD